jgi:hypothetical protein
MQTYGNKKHKIWAFGAQETKEEEISQACK